MWRNSLWGISANPWAFDRRPFPGGGKGLEGGVGGERLEGRLEGRGWRGDWRGEVGGGVGEERLKGRGLEEGVRGGVGAFQPCLGGTLSSAPAMARAP